MTDVVDARTRSRMMASIGRAHTLPELQVRRFLHAAGLRFRLHDRRLPGRPDIVLARWRVAIFVNGCFWHRHSGCVFAATPQSNAEFWRKKLEANVQRDAVKTNQLRAAGWRVLVIWECDASDEVALENLFWEIVGGSI
jgi:DNA mismatch endonuclease, patch repair protein